MTPPIKIDTHVRHPPKVYRSKGGQATLASGFWLLASGLWLLASGFCESGMPVDGGFSQYTLLHTEKSVGLRIPLQDLLRPEQPAALGNKER